MEKDKEVQKVDGLSTYLSITTHEIVDDVMNVFPKMFTKVAVFEGCVRKGARKFVEDSIIFWNIKIDKEKQDAIDKLYEKWRL